MCETCKEVTTATKRMRIHRFPNTLIIHLKRFKCTATSREKISNAIGFPVTDLKLHELATPESAHRKGDATYDLVGLCNHTGSMQGGHYTSACKVTPPPPSALFCPPARSISPHSSPAPAIPRIFLIESWVG